MALIDDVVFFLNHGDLPSGGGRNDQPAKFLRAIPIVREAAREAAEDRARLLEASRT